MTGTLVDLAARVASTEPGVTSRRIARESILDTAACIRAGWHMPQTAAVLAMLERTESRGPGARALVLGTAAHALDYDDFEQPGSTHPSAVLVPAILALSAQETVTVGAVETAYVAGYETILSLGLTLGYGHYMAGWHATGTLGTVGAAATAARLLGLDNAGALNALSLAMTRAAGLKAQFGSAAKAAHAGFAAQCGVEAACLAAAGLDAAPDVFAAEKGFAALYSPDGRRNLPETWIEQHPPYRKLSPSCGYSLRAIDAALEIAAQHRFDPAAIEAVEVEIAEPYHEVVRFVHPRTAHEARFSLTWCVACALTDGRVGLNHFSAEALARSDLVSLERKVAVRPYPLPEGAGDVSPDAPERVAVRLGGGEMLKSVCAVQRGGPGRPLDLGELFAKLADCGMSRVDAERFLACPGEAGFSGDLILPPGIWAALA